MFLKENKIYLNFLYYFLIYFCVKTLKKLFMKKIIFIALILFTSVIYAQQLVYKSGGKILDSNNIELSETQVRVLFENHPNMLNSYNLGKSNKKFGNIFIGVGAGLLVGDLAIGLTTDTLYPTAVTYAGIASVLISFIIKSGSTENIKKAVIDYNNQLIKKNSAFKIERIEFTSNQNSIGIQLIF